MAFRASGGNGVDLSIDTCVDPGCLDELAEIINKSGIYTWNGFDEYDGDVMDGYSFKLKAQYSDGKTLSANGCQPPITFR